MADHAREDERTRRHRGATRVLPAVVADASTAEPSGVELLLEPWSLEGRAEVWLYLGDGVEQRLELTLESARRLEAELRALLAALAS